MRDYAGVFQCLLNDLGHVVDDSFVGPRTSREVAMVSLKDSFFKKLSPVGNTPDADEAALQKFVGINSKIRSTRFYYEVENERDMAMWDMFLAKVGRVCCIDQANGFDSEFILGHLGVGPGASIGASEEGFYPKLFDSCLTSTSALLIARYRAAVFEHELWCEAEWQRSQRFGVEIVSANRLFFVPKNAEISRTCCTEPSVNMLFQKVIGSFLEECLQSHFGIDLATQPDRNREMARRGSVDGSRCTLDLVSASDSISMALCEVLFQNPGLTSWMRLARSPSTRLPDGTLLPLNMVSTMGNGFTFPLQTIIFACVVWTVYSLRGLPFSAKDHTYGVFGDDIVVCPEAYDDVVRMLGKLGFEVNDAKSFKYGPFRESCGFDYSNGYAVRGVYCRSLETDPDIYSTINRLNRWSAQHGKALHRLTGCLREMLVQGVNLVPFSAGDHEGHKVPFRVFSSVNAGRIKRNEYGSLLYKRITYKTRKRAVPIDKEGSAALGYADFNQCGWGISFLGGYARTQWPDLNPNPDEIEPVWGGHVAYLSVRDKPGCQRYWKTRKSYIPYWDWFGESDGRFSASVYEGWQTLVTLQFE